MNKFKGEGYYVYIYRSWLYYIETEEQYKKIMENKERGSVVPIDGSDYEEYIPFLNKVGRKVIEELQNLNGISICLDSDDDTHFYSLYNLYTGQSDMKTLIENSGIRHLEWIFDVDTKLSKMVREKIGYDKYINGLKNMKENLKKDTWYLFNYGYDRLFYKKYSDSADDNEFDEIADIKEVKDDFVLDKLSLLSRFIKYISKDGKLAVSYYDIEDCRTNSRDEFDDYSMGFFIKDMLLSDDIEAELRNNLDNELLIKDENVDILKEVLDLLKINSEEILKDLEEKRSIILNDKISIRELINFATTDGDEGIPFNYAHASSRLMKIVDDKIIPRVLADEVFTGSIEGEVNLSKYVPRDISIATIVFGHTVDGGASGSFEVIELKDGILTRSEDPDYMYTAVKKCGIKNPYDNDDDDDEKYYDDEDYDEDYGEYAFFDEIDDHLEDIINATHRFDDCDYLSFDSYTT